MEVKPFETENMHCWSFTKCEQGARVEMMIGDWNKEQFQAGVQSHDDIIGHRAMQNKLKNTRSQDHECDTNWRLHLEGNFFATMGYSRYRDPKGRAHGWVMFGEGCKAEDRKLLAVKVMLNCMGFYMDESDEGPASGGTTGGASSSSQPASGGATSSSQPLGGGVAAVSSAQPAPGGATG